MDLSVANNETADAGRGWLGNPVKRHDISDIVILEDSSDTSPRESTRGK
jgi:hypothetical protein